MWNRLLGWLFLVSFCPPVIAQVVIGKQQRFAHSVPAGNYSGLTTLGNDRYAVVSDKSPDDGFFVFHIDIDTITGKIVAVMNEGFCSSHQPNRDMEGIAYVADSKRLFIVGEADNQVGEYALDGRRLRLQPLPLGGDPARNYGLESLTYSVADSLLYTTTERPLVGDSLNRIFCLDSSLQLRRCCHYRMDKPVFQGKGTDVKGISELCALDDGRLLVLEREVYIPKLKLGARVNVRLYETTLDSQVPVLHKRLLMDFTTRLNLLHRNFANYEGLCVAHRYADGRYLLLMVSDSQNRYKGVLKDWFRTLILR